MVELGDHGHLAGISMTIIKTGVNSEKCELVYGRGDHQKGKFGEFGHQVPSYRALNEQSAVVGDCDYYELMNATFF